jgi:seryl-tRNA synthetase
MIDVRLLRQDVKAVQAALARKGVDAEAVERAAFADAKWRMAQAAADDLRRRRKEGSDAVAKAAPSERAALVEAMRVLSAEVEAAERELASAAAEARQALVVLPNPPDPGAPDGGEEDFTILRTAGDAEALGPGALDHAALGTSGGLWDTARAAKVSGARFSYLLHHGVLLEQALVRLALATVAEAGFRLMVPPVLVREPAMFGTGFFPTERSEYYEVDDGALFLVGTSEVPLAAYHGDEILDDLPRRYAGLSSCFRREAGAYGRDSAGIFRVHQFTKVEMFAFVEPEASREEHERILSVQESLVRALELPYRIIDTAAGDLGASAARKHDVEAWLPSEGRYREITSCSNCTDYQSRRLNVRYRAASGNEFVHTLNGTAMTDRWLLFIAEHYQQPDGTVAVPSALEPHLLAPR